MNLDCGETTNLTKWLDSFFGIFDYPGEAAEALLEAERKIRENQQADRFYGFVEAYERDREVDFTAALDACRAVAKSCGAHEYTVVLLLFICFSRRLKTKYLEAGYSETMWRESMLDLRCKLFECRNLFGIWGSFVGFWFPRFFTMTRFAFGRLQFEPGRFGHDGYAKGDKALKRGDPVISVHVPSMQAPLTPAACDDAFRRAAAFFRGKLNASQIAFYCGSWLLYSANKTILPPSSNILAFAARFDIVAEHEYDETNDDVLWRVFNVKTRSFRDVESFPTDTALRRGYAQHIKNGGKTGWAEGVFFSA